jgi:hypothetical protein
MSSSVVGSTALEASPDSESTLSRCFSCRRPALDPSVKLLKILKVVNAGHTSQSWSTGCDILFLSGTPL